MPSRRYSHSAFQNTKIILTIIASIYAVYRAGIVAEIEQAEIKFLEPIVHFTVHLTIALAGFNISLKCNGTVDIIRLTWLLLGY